jgi:hypothetical protein
MIYHLHIGNYRMLMIIASTYKRHGYYCRSKKPGQTISRKRACTSCSRAKIRCDWKLPRCTNCTTKDSECHYTDGALQNILNATSTISDDVDYPEGSSLVLSKSNDGLFSQDTPGELTSVLWPRFSLGLDGINDVSAPVTFSAKDSLREPIFANMLDLTDQSVLTASFPIPPASSYFPRSLDDSNRCIIRRRLINPHAQTHATLIIQILASFPTMMLRKDTFPPFIHPRSFSAIPGKEYDMPEALANCMSLAQLFKMRTKENSRFLWKSIRLEHERLWREVC